MQLGIAVHCAQKEQVMQSLLPLHPENVVIVHMNINGKRLKKLQTSVDGSNIAGYSRRSNHVVGACAGHSNSYASIYHY